MAGCNRVERLLPTGEAADLLELVRELADRELAPVVAEHERGGRFPRQVFRTLFGSTRDFPVERYMREAKVMQIFEGTDQIQRMVISRHLAKGSR